MTGGFAEGGRGPATRRGPRESRTERRERRAAVDDPALVLAAAARYLEVRSRSIAEVRRHLVDVGYRPALVDGAVRRLVDLGLLDDAAFARAWVASRDRARPRGERALRRELALKGIPDDTIAEVLAERATGTGERLDSLGAPLAPWVGQDDEDRDGASDGDTASADERAAERLLDRRGAALGRIADARVRRQRAYALLARNGFDPDVCRRVAARVDRSAARGDEPDADAGEAEP